MKLTKNEIIDKITNSSLKDKDIVICSPRSYCDMLDLFPDMENKFTYSFYLTDDVYYINLDLMTEKLEQIEFK